MKSERIKELETKKVGDRTREEHFELMNFYGSARDYFLSMGEFKNIPMKDGEYPIDIEEWNNREKYWVERLNNEKKTLEKQFWKEKIKITELSLNLIKKEKDNLKKEIDKVFYSVPQPTFLKEKYEEEWKKWQKK